MRKCDQKLSATIVAALTVVSGSAEAAGFALMEQNASGLGNAYAGAAAVAEDASTIFFNPAGLTRVPGRQLVVAAHAIRPSNKFGNQGSTEASAFIPNPSGPLVTGNGGDAGGWAFVPNLYYAMDLRPQWKFGLGVSAPFGLKTEYDSGWTGRYHALKSDLKTINVNPTLAYRVNDSLSIGVGLSYQRIDAELTNAIPTPFGDGKAKLEGDDDSWGFNFGVMFDAGPNTRIGLSYRSTVDYTLEGTVKVSVPAPLASTTTPIRADITMPDTFSASLVHRLNPQWELLGDWSRTRWSEIQSIRITNASTGALVSTLDLLFDDADRISLGANYQYDERLKLRFGIAFDQTPVRNAATRTARLPDNDRIWLAIGGKYRVSQTGTLDFGYAHLFVRDPDINRNATVDPLGGTVRLKGGYDNDANIVSVQYTHNF